MRDNLFRKHFFLLFSQKVIGPISKIDVKQTSLALKHIIVEREIPDENLTPHLNLYMIYDVETLSAIHEEFYKRINISDQSSYF